jgi:feruloyl-CoA synthase
VLPDTGLPSTGLPDTGAPGGDLVADEELLRMVADALARHNESHGSAASIARLAILARPASLDAGEITDKGYLNQRRVLTERAGLVELLYASPVPPGVIVPRR